MSTSEGAFQQEEWDTLVHALRGWGVRYFTGGHRAAEAENDTLLREPTELICRLAQSSDPRLRQSIASLMLVHPELAPQARAAACRLASPGRERLIEAYVAAAYLQRLWRTRLRRHLGEQPDLPPYWIDEMGLPAPDEGFGRVGLASLGERYRRTKSGRPLGRVRRTAYEQVPLHLFAQFIADRTRAKAA